MIDMTMASLEGIGKTFHCHETVRAIALPHNAETPSGSREQEHNKRLLLHARYSSAVSSPRTTPID
jgi:hypothetical protein